MILTHGMNSIKRDGGSATSVRIGERDYPVVQIGDYLVMAENLDYKYTGLPIGPTGNPASQAAWYYDDSESTYGVNGNKYGLLYNGYAANYMYSHAADLFPDGWNLLGDNGWYVFLMSLPTGTDYHSGNVLKSTSDWLHNGNGIDSLGFNAKPAGFRDSGVFRGVGDFAAFAQGAPKDTNLHLNSPYWGAANDSTPYGDDARYAVSVRLFKRL